ncbi:MAG: 5-oxoprolinase [Candidatus Kuenenia sp.]|nr:5-oxoprolinase [Candidatus Kuenenia hertensis]
MQKDIPRIRFAIDRGGTFTDIYAEIPGKEDFYIEKLLSKDPQNYEDPAIEGIRRIIGKVTGKPVSGEKINPEYIDWIRMGTTIATNALLERKGERVALVITKGFRDLLQIGNQTRPKIFELNIRKPELLYETVVEVDERVLPVKKRLHNQAVERGISNEYYEILAAPDLEKVKDVLLTIKKKGINSLAIVFMHGYNFPKHEVQVAEIAKTLGFAHISLSSQVMPMVRIIPRGQTTVVDTYLTPHIQVYLDSFHSGFSGELRNSQLLFMQSDGGLSYAKQFRGCNAILSGPAGGVVGYAMTTCQQDKKQPVIGFDMGGTSTDVSRFAGEYELIHETETAGISIQAPQMFIKTVAAGGGSRLFFQEGMFVVGPESVGADPGPMCYRKKGFLSITDANLLLGRLHPDYFPKIFGKNHDLPLDKKATEMAFEKLTREVNNYYKDYGKTSLTVEEVASGFINVANEIMARAIREISIMRGYNLKEHILATFGGAGGQHACSIAKKLGISKIFIHRFAGILSAYGMGFADVVIEKQTPSNAMYSAEKLPSLLKQLRRLANLAQKQLQGYGFRKQHITLQFFLSMRYEGTDTSLMIPQPHDMHYDRVFKNEYFREFGFCPVSREIVVDDLRVRAIGMSTHIKRSKIKKQTRKVNFETTTRCYFDGCWYETPIYFLETLGSSCKISGPAIILSDTSTIIVEPDCTATITEYGDVEITIKSAKKNVIGTKIDPVNLSVFSNMFMSIAEQMGRTLQRTAISTNIKERLDFSCAVFDRSGNLVANAPHIPVHLGSMGEAVKAQIRMHHSGMKKGDVFVTNHPVIGGTHLPDITVITPVWIQNKIAFYVASRGHHADIGGISPGSMPPFSRMLGEEGVCIQSFKLVTRGTFQEEGIRELLKGSRRLEDNISDLQAQIAANQKGANLLQEMAQKYTLKTTQIYMQYIQDNAEKVVREMFKGLSRKKGLNKSVVLKAVDYMDDGSPIRLAITINRENGNTLFDFSETGAQVFANWNAPRAITISAIIYTLRCLIEKDIPLNQGFLNPITIKIPDGTLLSPSSEAAVAGGNVLTSQRIVDVIFKAFGVVAASQGCMNNLTFGNERISYYETIGGGAGAGASWHGQSGVHTHMTNTRITDPEILEFRYPVQLREFSLRKNSGGKGLFRGGDGLVREIEAREEFNAAILSERRVFAPYGMNGGENGAKGKNIFLQKNGGIFNLGGKNEIKMNQGDRIRIETPGGGGYGKIC